MLPHRSSTHRCSAALRRRTSTNSSSSLSAASGPLLLWLGATPGPLLNASSSFIDTPLFCGIAKKDIYQQFEQFVGSFRAIDLDRKSTRLNSSHLGISYAVFC